MQQNIKISSIIIAKNEELNIQRCIESQLRCIDEIVVIVDDNSFDKTVEIIKSFPQIKFEVTKWMGYAKTKKYAVSLTSNNWVLWIDADEAVTPELSDEIIKFKESFPTSSAYSIPRLANFLGKWIKYSGWYPGRVIRLFDKNKALFSEKDVHEDLIVNGDIGKLNNNLEHYTDPTIKHYFEKFNNYTSLAAEELKRDNKKFHISDIILRPVFIFIKMYFIKLGFLDGVQGFILAIFSSAYVFTKYSKFWELNNKKGNT